MNAFKSLKAESDYMFWGAVEEALQLVLVIIAIFLLFYSVPRLMGQSESPFGQYIVDFNNVESVTQWLQLAKFEKLASADDRMRLICANIEVLRHGADPKSVKTLGYFRTPLGGTTIICVSDAKVPDNIYIRRTCEVINRKFVRVEGTKIICASKGHSA